MTNPFRKLKETARERLELMRSLTRPDLGSHKRTRLIQAGCGNSRSLLHDDVAKAHSKLLGAELKCQFKHQNGLRLLTVLHAVSSLDRDEVMRSIRQMEDCLYRSLLDTGTRCIGAIEVEVVNLNLMARSDELKQDQARKRMVLEGLTGLPGTGLDVGVLIHFHGVVDMCNSILRDTDLRTRLACVDHWRRAAYQVEIKNFFQNKSLSQNLDHIAAYLTKGGNNTLRYNLGFGREFDDRLDAQIWRGGLGRADSGGQTVTDPQSLSFAEIEFLDQLWVGLMIRQFDNRGYLLRIG